MRWSEQDWAQFTARRDAEMAARAKGTTLVPVEPAKAKRSNSGKRNDLDGMYFRSSWEANIARYLNWLVSVGAVEYWEYETEEFEFHKIKRGNRFYKIDFKLKYKRDDGPVYWEVKGYLDASSKTKLARMARYYPHIKIVVIDRKAYQQISREASGVIPNWEGNRKAA